MSVPLANHQITQANGNATGTGDKLTFVAPMDCVVVRWGVFGLSLLAVNAGMVVALDVIPSKGGTRVNGAVSSGFDTAGGTISTGITDVALGTGLYHEPKFDPSGTVSKGTGVNAFGNMLLLKAGDTAVIEVTTAAGTAGSSAQYWIEYVPLALNKAQADDDNILTEKAS